MSLIHPLINLSKEYVVAPWKKPLEVKINHDSLVNITQRIMSLPIAVALFTGLFTLAAYSKARKFIVLPWEKPLELDSNNQIRFNIHNLNHLVNRIVGLPIAAGLIVGMFTPTLSLSLIMLNVLWTLEEADNMLLSYSGT